MSARVVVTGLGFITCIGNCKRSVRESLQTLRSGLSRRVFFGNENLPVKVAGAPQGFEVDGSSWRRWKIPEPYAIDQGFRRSLSPQGLYAFCSVEQALRDASLEVGDVSDSDTGLYCGSVGSPLMLGDNLEALRRSNGERGNPMAILSSIAGTLNFNLGSWLGIQGANCGYVSACASSSHALGYAFDDIALGRQTRAIVVGAEDATADTLIPFLAMRTLSVSADPLTASRPFDAARDGFVGSGGAVTLILEAEEAARARGVEAYAELAGWAQASDGHHRASPHPEGRGLARAMGLAMRAAGVSPDEIDYVNAHATSTLAGDIAEAKALSAVFGEATNRIPVSSVKGIAGHALSMAGALEAAVCCLALREGFIPGNANLDEIDPQCRHLNLPNATRESRLTWILNNSSGFGGSNVCGALRRYVR